jgi:hypothetical protein
MTRTSKLKHILISFAEHEKYKPRKVCLSTYGDLQPAAIPPLSAKISPNLQLMASPTLHTSPHPKAYLLQDEHEPVQSHPDSLLVE